MKVAATAKVKQLLVLFSLVWSLVSCYTPSKNAQGFGKKPTPEQKKNDAVTAPAASAAKSEQNYLQPFGLELKSNNNGGDDDYRSVQTLTDRSAGDILLEIPLQDTITVDSLRSRLASCSAQNSEEITDEEEALALGLLRLKKELSDPYILNVLPQKHYNVWTLPGDLWKETAALMPRCYSETFGATRQRVNKFATEIAESKAYDFSVDDVLWAFSMVRSRSLAVPELNNDSGGDGIALALIPGLDLLNHEFGSGTQLQLVEGENESSSKWVLTSSDSIAAGKEVFLSYGDEKDNWKLLLTYGFSLPNNPNAVVFWSWKDLLDAASAVRPDTFSERVCKQLMRHPQLEAYTVLSEQRATFSYDIQANAPRESLANGLIMLNSLAGQLGKPESDSDALGQQVLDALLSRRLEELQDGQSRLKALEVSLGDEHSEWKPFLGSLRIALQAEQEQLQRTNTN